MFNDSISFYKKASDTLICAGDKFSPDGTSLIDQDCHKTGIALGSDVKSSFKPTKEIKQLSGPMWTNAGDPSSSDPFLKEGYYFGEPGHKIPETMDEDLIVWTNVAYLADFSKLYRVIDVDLVAGDYYFYIVENFDVVSFEGEKHVRLVTRNWIGGRNHVLGILLTVVGSVAFVFALCVMIITCIKSRGLNSI
ncbi:hypothetical protein AGDE_02503 [Angomonas deanei]|nr:hypothetical protein AGDE_02503 [Angomonas deanei]|eukprot:EPY41421.1 hypothetical protein AGDE_02503 [Angomonas deanei]